MKKGKIIGIVIALCMVVCPMVVQAAGVPTAVKGTAKSVVDVIVTNSFGTENATGIVMSKGAEYVVVSLNAVEGSKDIKVSYGDEKVPASVHATDKSKNLAVLKLAEEQSIKKVKPIRFNVKDKEKDTEIYILNREVCNDIEKIKSGIITDGGTLSVEKNEPVNIYMVNVDIERKDSGAILSDKYGNLLGICYYDGVTNVNKVLKAEEITEFFDMKDIPYKKTTILFVLIPIALILIVLGVAAYLIVNAVKKRIASQPVLEGVQGEFAGKIIGLTEENISIGRDSKICQIVILHGDKVSRCHCSIRYDKNKDMFMLTDLSSTHGTYLSNGEKLESNVPKYLNAGETFKVGDDSNVFRVKIGGDIS